MNHTRPEFIVEIFLQPGEFLWGDESNRIRTLLGSCVSLTFHHPNLNIGGMCHFMLPSRERKLDEGLSGRYADECLLLFIEAIQRSGTRPRDYEVKMFGGGNMFPTLAEQKAGVIGERNVNTARDLIARHGLKLVAEDVGGVVHRRLLFDVWSGDVWLKRLDPVRESPAAVARPS